LVTIIPLLRYRPSVHGRLLATDAGPAKETTDEITDEVVDEDTNEAAKEERDRSEVPVAEKH
jgi:hypothetical protein